MSDFEQIKKTGSELDTELEHLKEMIFYRKDFALMQQFRRVKELTDKYRMEAGMCVIHGSSNEKVDPEKN